MAVLPLPGDAGVLPLPGDADCSRLYRREPVAEEKYGGSTQWTRLSYPSTDSGAVKTTLRTHSAWNMLALWCANADDVIRLVCAVFSHIKRTV